MEEKLLHLSKLVYDDPAFSTSLILDRNVEAQNQNVKLRVSLVHLLKKQTKLNKKPFCWRMSGVCGAWTLRDLALAPKISPQQQQDVRPLAILNMRSSVTENECIPILFFSLFLKNWSIFYNISNSSLNENFKSWLKFTELLSFHNLKTLKKLSTFNQHPLLTHLNCH